jgi:hypothetical protein
LGITLADVGHLANTLRIGVLDAPISDVRGNAPYGLLCEVCVSAVGLREKAVGLSQ